MDDGELRLAAALTLVVREGHPVYPSTATWHGGIGGQAMTTGCNFRDPKPRDGEWALDIEIVLRDWMRDHTEDEVDAVIAASDALKAELLAPHLNPEN